MSADNRATNFGGLLEATPQDPRDGFWRNQVLWESHQVERGDRPAAHRKNIGERIGGGDLTVSERVINDRGKKVHGLHERTMQVQTIDAGVIECARVHEHIAISINW